MGELIYTGILIGINIIDPISVDWFCTKISQRKNGRAGYRVMVLLGIIGYIVVQPFLLEMFVENAGISYLINNSLFALKVLYVVGFYDISKRKAFIYLVAQFFIDTVVEYTFTLLLMVLSQFSLYLTSGNNLIKLIVVVIMHGISIWTLTFLVKVNSQYSCAVDNSRIFLIFLSFLVDEIVLGVLFCKTYKQGNSVFLIGTLIVLAYEIVILLYSSYCIVQYKKKEQEYQEVIEFTDKQIKMLNHTQEKISKSQKIIHDMTNHLYTLQLMAEKNMNGEIIQYVQKLIPEVKRERVTDVTNSILAVILFEKRAKAKQHGVDLECDVRKVPRGNVA